MKSVNHAKNVLVKSVPHAKSARRVKNVLRASSAKTVAATARSAYANCASLSMPHR